MERRTYYDFALSDYLYLMEDYERGRISNVFCSVAQNTCERFLKEIVDNYYEAENEIEESKKNIVLKTHNLNNLLNFLKNDMNISISLEERRNILLSNGYYFSTRYPGDDCTFATEEDVEDCYLSLKTTKEFTDKVILNLKERENDFDNNFEELE